MVKIVITHSQTIFPKIGSRRVKIVSRTNCFSIKSQIHTQIYYCPHTQNNNTLKDNNRSVTARIHKTITVHSYSNRTSDMTNTK